MNKMLLAALLLLPNFALAGTPNPGDYTVAIHVSASRLINYCTTDTKGSSCGYVQHLETTIGGKKYELERVVASNVLRVGDYKAKLIEGKQPRAEEYTRSYEFLFSDGKTGRFRVVGESE
jgi:hypothetical protein